MSEPHSDRVAPAIPFWYMVSAAITGLTPHGQRPSVTHCRCLYFAPRMVSWLDQASECPPPSGRDTIHWSGSLVVMSEAKASTSATAITSRVVGVWRGLLTCWVSCKGLSASCKSESKTTGAGFTLVFRYFRLVTATLASSSLTLLILPGSLSGWTGSKGPPKRTLWR